MEFQTIAPGANPNISNYMQNKQSGSNGKQQKALALKRVSLIQKLKVSKTCREATVVNFNPVPLRLEGGIAYKVPSIIDPSVPEDRLLKFNYKGRQYKATMLTIAEPFIYPIIRDVNLKQGEDAADGVGVYDVLPCQQIEIAHLFWTAYNQGATDSSNMGGVLIFEGNRHTLKDIAEPGFEIQFPTFASLPDNAREYYTEPKEFRGVLAEQLDKQRVYCDNEMQTASIYFNDDEQRKNITTVHRVWHQFALDMGWKEKPEPWLLSQRDAEESCDGCGSAKKRANAYFCGACARPYDPFKAYMDGELGMDSVHLNRIKDSDWALVHEEEKRRKSIRRGRNAEEAK